MAAAAGYAAAIVVLFSWRWRKSPLSQTSIGSLLGAAGRSCRRLLFLRVPVEALVAGRSGPAAADRVSVDHRGGIAVGVLAANSPADLDVEIAHRGWHCALLLFNSTYVADLAGPGSREWTPVEQWFIFGGLAGALVGSWAALDLLARRSRSRGLSVALAFDCEAAGDLCVLPAMPPAGRSAFRSPRRCWHNPWHSTACRPAGSPWTARLGPGGVIRAAGHRALFRELRHCPVRFCFSRGLCSTGFPSFRTSSRTGRDRPGVAAGDHHSEFDVFESDGGVAGKMGQIVKREVATESGGVVRAVASGLHRLWEMRRKPGQLV